MRLVASLLIGSIALAGCAGMAGQGAGNPKPIAVSQLNPTQGNKTNGSVSFVQNGDRIIIDARIDGLTPGAHGFHVHERGDCSAPDGMSAGGHFNPSGRPHGGPEHADRHAGDFGNLNADANGNAVLRLTVPASQISLAREASNSVVGKALIVHTDPDDYKTQPTGNAGKRVACGIIALQ